MGKISIRVIILYTIIDTKGGEQILYCNSVTPDEKKNESDKSSLLSLGTNQFSYIVSHEKLRHQISSTMLLANLVPCNYSITIASFSSRYKDNTTEVFNQ